MKAAQDRAAFERLFIEPVRHTSGSWSSTRRPKEHERLDLKILTSDFYGLWAVHGDDKSKWTVDPMLSDTINDDKPAPLPLKDVILAHMWPSKNDYMADEVASLLGLERGFSLQPRNFLLLPKFVEAALDCDASSYFLAAGHRPRLRRELTPSTCCPSLAVRV